LTSKLLLNNFGSPDTPSSKSSSSCDNLADSPNDVIPTPILSVFKFFSILFLSLFLFLKSSESSVLSSNSFSSVDSQYTQTFLNNLSPYTPRRMQNQPNSISNQNN
jgi:hypothetical protein